jgi:VWFA-related protein
VWAEFVHVANANNITAYPIDTMGLRVGSAGRPTNWRATDAYIALANHVGGRALVNNNSFDEGLTRIFSENTSYYLLAYQPTNSEEDGRFRRVSVKVNRPDVEVVSSRNYWGAESTRPQALDCAAAVA